MRKAVMFLFLLCGAWVVAQTSSSSQTNQDTSNQTSDRTGQNTSSTGGTMKVTGCVSGSDGNYSLIDNSGKTWQLAGDTSRLKDHVGHTVQIRGTSSEAAGTAGGSATSSGSTTASTSNMQTLNVTSLKMISSSCAPSTPSR